MPSRSEKSIKLVPTAVPEGEKALLPTETPAPGITKEQFDALAAKVDGLEGLTRDVLTGIKDKLAPRIDAMESFMSKLPEELKASFKVQGEAMVKYVDSKTGTTAAATQQGGGGILGFVQEQIKQAGGLGKLLQGGGASGQTPLADEINMLEKLLLERERSVVRNSLRAALNLPPLPVPEAVIAPTGAVTLTSA